MKIRKGRLSLALTSLFAVCLLITSPAQALNPFKLLDAILKKADEIGSPHKIHKAPASLLINETTGVRDNDVLENKIRSAFISKAGISPDREFVQSYKNFLNSSEKNVQNWYFDSPKHLFSNLNSQLNLDGKKVHPLTWYSIINETAPNTNMKMIREIIRGYYPEMTGPRFRVHNYVLSSGSSNGQRPHKEFGGEAYLFDHNEERFKQYSYYEPVKFKNKIFALSPNTSEEFENIFGAAPSPAEWSRLQKDLEQLSNYLSEDALRQPVEQPSSTDVIVKSIKDPAISYVTIIGHNEKGRLKLPTGEELGITNLSKLCAKHTTRCIFLSCESSRYAPVNNGYLKNHYIDSKITFAEAGIFASRLDLALKAPSALRETPVRVSLQQVENEVVKKMFLDTNNFILRRRKVKAIIIPGTFSAVSTGYVIHLVIDDKSSVDE